MAIPVFHFSPEENCVLDFGGQTKSKWAAWRIGCGESVYFPAAEVASLKGLYPRCAGQLHSLE
jgi:hypothetical protein